LEIGSTVINFRRQQHEEPCEVRVSRTVLWESRGEIPRLDPIAGELVGA
jgi:hypothetical protein